MKMLRKMIVQLLMALELKLKTSMVFPMMMKRMRL
jgi:hypothetical protein